MSLNKNLSILWIFRFIRFSLQENKNSLLDKLDFFPDRQCFDNFCFGEIFFEHNSKRYPLSLKASSKVCVRYVVRNVCNSLQYDELYNVGFQCSISMYLNNYHLRFNFNVYLYYFEEKKSKLNVLVSKYRLDCRFGIITHAGSLPRTCIQCFYRDKPCNNFRI